LDRCPNNSYGPTTGSAPTTEVLPIVSVGLRRHHCRIFLVLVLMEGPRGNAVRPRHRRVEVLPYCNWYGFTPAFIGMEALDVVRKFFIEGLLLAWLHKKMAPA